MNVFVRYPESGEYYGRFTDPTTGKRCTVNLRTRDVRQAKADLRARVSALKRGLFQVIDQRRAEAPCALAALFEEYGRRAACQPATARHNVLAVRGLLRHAGRPVDEGQPSSVLNRDLVRDAQAALLRAVGEGPEARRRASVTANSLRRQARSLFTPELLDDYQRAGLHLPTVSDFMRAPALPVPTAAFTLPPATLVQAMREAAPKLQASDPNTFRIYLLAAGAGLRKREIAFARWDWIQTIDGRPVLAVQGNEEFRTKSARPRLVPLDLLGEGQPFRSLQELRITRLGPGADYLLDGHLTERTDWAFRRFSAWLHGLGWTRVKQAHELRKLFGSYLCQSAGLSVAQDLLGHAQVSTTKAYYVGQVTLPTAAIPL
jgi:integrase